MKRTLLFALALVAAGCAEPIPRNLDDMSRQGEQYLDPETLEPYSGPAYRMSEDDSTKIVLRVNLRDGRFHGDFEDFEPDEFADRDSLGIYETGTYRDGQREGRHEYFYPSGVLRGRGTFENGLQEGSYESYYENGEPRNKINYTDGELDGPYEHYYENGQLQRKGTYAAGEEDGPYETYDEDGQLQIKATSAAGERDGPYEWYYENGQLERKGTYAAGERDGPYETYDEDGQLSWKGTYNMGERCGEWIVDGRTVTHDPCPPGLADGN